jgi:hypothetical protein
MVSVRAPVTSRAKAMFSAAVRSSSSRKSWNTIPSRRRRRGTSSALSVVTLYPDTRTSPALGFCSAKRSFMIVDLPAPE